MLHLFGRKTSLTQVANHTMASMLANMFSFKVERKEISSLFLKG
jgi:hypothetical protein